uniref:Uncharacterized protein KIAA0930 homolog n=2 Tax=Schistocephalus solidus TaxID=70667 RepID=A0A0V0J2S8_SCHSO
MPLHGNYCLQSPRCSSRRSLRSGCPLFRPENCTRSPGLSCFTVNGEPLTTRRFGSNTNLQVLGRRPRPTDKILDPSGVSQSRTFLRILAARSEALAEVAVHFGTGTAPPPLEFCVRPGVARSVSASCRMTKNSYPLVGVENLALHSRRWTADSQSQHPPPPPPRRLMSRAASAETDKHRSSSVTNSPMHNALEGGTQVQKRARVFFSRSTSPEQLPTSAPNNKDTVVSAPTSRVAKLISDLAGFTTSPSRRVRSYNTRSRGRGGGGGGGVSQLTRKTRSAGGELDHLSERFGSDTKMCTEVEATTFEDGECFRYLKSSFINCVMPVNACFANSGLALIVKVISWSVVRAVVYPTPDRP